MLNNKNNNKIQIIKYANITIYITFSVVAVTSYLFSFTYKHSNLENLLLFLFISSLLLTLNLSFFITFTKEVSDYKRNNFPSYGNFFSIHYWSRIDKENFIIICIFFFGMFFFGLIFSIFLVSRTTNPSYNENNLLLAFILTVFLHALGYFLSRDRIRKIIES